MCVCVRETEREREAYKTLIDFKSGNHVFTTDLR